MVAGSCDADVGTADAVLRRATASEALFDCVHQKDNGRLQPFRAEDRVDGDCVRHLVGRRLRRLADGEDLLQPFPRRCGCGLTTNSIESCAIDRPALQPVDQDVDDRARLDLLLTSEQLDHRIASVDRALAGGVGFRNAPQVREECRFPGRQQPRQPRVAEAAYRPHERAPGQPLVDELTFAKAQAILAERGEHAKRRGNASDFILSGLLRCGKCGKAYIGMSANGNGGRYHYYACSGRQKYGPKVCDGERLPREKIEAAVIDQLATLYRDEHVIGDALARANAEAETRRPEFEQRLASISAEITRAEQALERYYEAFEQGKLSAERCEDRLVRLQARLDDLRAQEAELSLQAPDEAAHAPTAADLAEIADAIEAVSTEGDPQKAKALLRLLIDELRVNGRAEILPTYRLVTPEVCAMSEKVGAAGIEHPRIWASFSHRGMHGGMHPTRTRDR